MKWPDITKIKQDVKTLTTEIIELKKLKRKYDKLNYSYAYYDLQHDKRYWWRRITIESSASITDEMIKEQEVNYNKYWDCVRELHKKQYHIRHLFIVYGQIRGKTREQIEPKYAECKFYSYNIVTKHLVQGNDPIDKAYIWELKRDYLPQAEERP